MTVVFSCAIGAVLMSAPSMKVSQCRRPADEWFFTAGILHPIHGLGACGGTVVSETRYVNKYVDMIVDHIVTYLCVEILGDRGSNGKATSKRSKR